MPIFYTLRNNKKLQNKELHKRYMLWRITMNSSVDMYDDKLKYYKKAQPYFTGGKLIALWMNETIYLLNIYKY